MFRDKKPPVLGNSGGFFKSVQRVLSGKTGGFLSRNTIMMIFCYSDHNCGDFFVIYSDKVGKVFY